MAIMKDIIKIHHQQKARRKKLLNLPIVFMKITLLTNK